MSEQALAPLNAWLIEPMEQAVAAVVSRVRRAPDVQLVAIMPDVHLANDVTVGTVIATEHLLYPQAVGGDIGCGMLAVALHGDRDRLADPAIAGRILSNMARAVPLHRHHRGRAQTLADRLTPDALSHPSLASAAREEGRLQLGTLGGGNHFIELQSDEARGLWLMIHSGSRVMGQLIKAHHMARGVAAGGGLVALDSREPAGAAYAADVLWARAYAEANRRAISMAVAEVLADAIGASIDESSTISVDHNHLARESHGGRELWIHRKGAMPASIGAPGLLPGSMGTLSFHVEGLGCAAAIDSSAHGAGRLMSRHAAQKRISARDLHRQMSGVWYDYRNADSLREEAPLAYKDVRAVLRAQHDLVKVTRVLKPLLNFKGR